MLKKILKITAYVLGAVLLLVGAVLLYFNFKGLPSYPVDLPDFALEKTDSATVARGKYLVNQTCALCHLADDRTLSGKLMEDGPFGVWYTPNITNHPTKGLGRYSDAELLYLLRTGIKKDGVMSAPFMSRFTHTADEDLEAIIAFLRSDDPMVAGKDVEQPAPKPSILAKILINLAFKPMPYPEKKIVAPPTSDQVAYGKYLATSVLECYGCHSANFQTNDMMVPENSAGYFGGGNSFQREAGSKEVVYSANLTMHPEYGIGKWTVEDFKNAVKYGQRPGGPSLAAVMPKFSLKDEDIEAIWAYLQTVPIQENEVLRAMQ